MTRSPPNTGSSSPTEPRAQSHPESLRHPPKPATMGLDADNHPSDAAGSSFAEQHRSGNGRAATDQRSIAALIKELRDEAVHLLRHELLLARTEAAEKASFFAKQSGKIGAGGAVLLVGALLLLSGLACLVAWVFTTAWEWHTTSALAAGYAIVGVIIALVGYGLYRAALSRMRGEPLVPERTLQSLKEDKQWLIQKTTGATP